MKVFYEIAECTGWNDELQANTMHVDKYFQGIYNAYYYCKDKNADYGNYIPPIEDVIRNLSDFGEADIGYLTIIQLEFED
jgi:hypothetical protein